MDYTVAYVDDNPSQVFNLERHCRAFNKASEIHSVNYLGYSDVYIFLSDYKANPERFDSVVIDINLDQGMDGWELSKQVLDVGTEITIIMLSNDIDEDDTVSAMMSKRHFKFSELVNRICEIKKKSRAFNVLQIFMRMGDIKGCV